MESHREAYREEAIEVLAELEDSLLELEGTPDNFEAIDRVFRFMHNIKGSGAMFGFDDISSFTHEIETVYDKVRDGIIAVTKHLIDLTLAACDQIRKMLDDDNMVDEGRKTDIESAFRDLLDHGPSSKEDEQEVTDEIGISEEDKNRGSGNVSAVYRIRFRPYRDFFSSGANPILLVDELRELGDIKVVPHLDDVPRLEDMDPEGCYIHWDIVLATSEGIDAIKDVFIFAEDECDLSIESLYGESGPSETNGEEGVKEERTDDPAESEQDQAPTVAQAATTDEEEKKTESSTNKTTSTVGDTLLTSGSMAESSVKAAATSIRVSADKLDMLVDLVGELVTVQARLSQKSHDQTDPDLSLIAEEVERLTGELRDNTMSIRMLPIGTTFNKYKRLVRDLSNELGKEITLTTKGGNTELDKTVIERLSDPLVHIIRNSIDHGIESPEVRESKGKPRQGVVHLSATHMGANVLIRISDDGNGLNLDAIRSKAIERGLISSEAEMTENEIASLIFAAGFSTAEKVTDVSGRGVGMDVVKRSVEALQGSIDVNTRTGSGTTFTMKLPLTLAIIEGLLVKIDGAHFVLPLSSVEECVELTREEVEQAKGRHIKQVREELVPYLYLREIFEIDNPPPRVEEIVIAEVEGSRLGFVVDQVIGQHQTVIKSMGKVYSDAKEFSGATIMPDGTVALILDTYKLYQCAEKIEQGSADNTVLCTA